MSVALLDASPDGRRGGDKLDTPFGVYTLLVDLGHASRERLGTDRLFAALVGIFNDVRQRPEEQDHPPSNVRMLVRPADTPRRGL